MNLSIFLAAVVGIFLGIFVGILLVIYFTRPSIMIDIASRLGVWFSGQTLKYVSVGNYKMCYGERGQPSTSPHRPTVVFLHGYSGSKTAWSGTVKEIPRDVHVINIDLPAHGFSGCDPKVDLNIRGLTTRLRQFFEVTGLTRYKLHLIGASMGGAVAGCYAADHPDHVALLTLLCPVSRTPELSRLAKDIQETGESALTDSSFEGYCNVLRLGLNMEILPFSTQFIKGLADLRRPHYRHWVPLFQSMVTEIWTGEEDKYLGKVAKHIETPTQIIWGKIDQIAHYSGAESLRKELPSCRRVHILEGMGHSFPYGHDRQMAQLVMDFQRDEMNKQQQDREPQNENQHDREPHHEKQHDREPQHEKQHDREPQHEKQHDREPQNEKQHDREPQNEKQHDREPQKEKQHDREPQNEKQHDREPQNEKQHDREPQNEKQHDREPQNEKQHDREPQNEKQHDREPQNEKQHDREPQHEKQHDREPQHEKQPHANSDARLRFKSKQYCGTDE